MSNPFRLFMPRLLCFISSLLLVANACANPVTNLLHPASALADRNYTGLRDALYRYENAAAHPWPEVPAARYKLNAKNAGVPILRERLKASGDLPEYYSANDRVYDYELEQAVRSFQDSHGLTPDGVVGAKTLSALNVPAEVRLRQIEVNMQRWATLVHQFPTRFIMVNIPNFRLYVFDNDQEVLSMKAIVGKPDRQTPELSSKVTRIVLNPYWNVPEMIAKRDIAPKVLENPGYLDEMHIRIFANQEDNAAELSADEVNWESAARNGVPYRLRQDPGDNNALGLVKFEFQNDNNVYLHDTPTKNLFDEDKRTFSSGCIRLENPLALVSYLMEPDAKWQDDHVQEVLSIGKTTYVKAARPTPIFITYFTVWVDDKGVLNFRDDVYERDQ